MRLEIFSNVSMSLLTVTNSMCYFYRIFQFRNVIIFNNASNYHVGADPLALKKDWPPYCPLRNSIISANSLMETDLTSLSPENRAAYRAQRRWHRCLGHFCVICQDEIPLLLEAEKQHAIYLRKKRISDFDDSHAFLKAKEQTL